MASMSYPAWIQGDGVVQVGLSTASYFSRFMTEDALSAIVASGAPVCEVFLNSRCEYTPSFAKKLLKRAEGAVKFHAVHAMSTQFEPQLFSINARQRTDAFKTLEKVLDMANALSAKCYVMHGPLLLMGAAKNLELGRVAGAANEVAERCVRRGLRLGWENVSYCLFNEPDLPLWLERLGMHDNLGFTLDIKQAARRGHDPMDYIARMGKRLVNVHACDYVWQGEKLSLRLPMRGSFDFSHMMESLKAFGYKGPLLVEVYSDMYHDESELYRSVRELTEAARTF